jgi:NADPH:quinone reductase-like Zn-dependent oxidoreductase
MKALVLHAIHEQPRYVDYADPMPAPGEVLVQVRAAALNRRDYFITQGLYPGIVLPIILGSDGAGVCEGRDVIINPNINWGDNAAVQSKHYNILGLPKNGAFAEQVAVAADRLHDKPAHLDWAQAAALPLAGMTAWRALFTKGQVQPGHHVLVTGAGGGVALFAIQFALAAGAQVFVTTGSHEKLERAKQLGASGGAIYRDSDWDRQLAAQCAGFDVVIDSAGGPGFPSLLKLCNPGARVVIYGGTVGKIPDVSPQLIFWKQLAILGSTMANDTEFKAMLEFVNLHHIVPIVDSVFDLADGAKAFKRLAANTQFGKIVLTPS